MMQALSPSGTPDPMEFASQVFALDFHPSEDVGAVGLIDGQVSTFRYSPTTEYVSMHSHHSKSCRDLKFTGDGKALVTASSDCSLGVIDLETMNVVIHKGDAHESPIYSIYSHEHMLASGDESGCIKVWDMRQRKQIYSWRQHEDFIGCITFFPERNSLLTSSADGSIGVFNVAEGAIVGVSDQQEDELLSIVVMKNGRKVVVGSQDGVVNIFNWGEWGDISDRFPGHPRSIDCMVKIDEDTLFTGSSDGMIRIVGIHPNKLLGVVGEHGEFPVERMALSWNQRLLASCSHDQTVRFWDVGYIFDDDDDDDDEGEEDGEEVGEELTSRKQQHHTRRGFFSGLE